MDGKLEVERKYRLPGGFALPDLTGIGGVATVGEPDDQRLDAVYYDTESLRLARGRVTLRRRSGGNDAGWHLKRPAGGERSELQVPATSRHHTPPRAVADQVRALTRGEELIPVARIRTHRVERALRAADGSTVALVADDRVRTESLRGGAARKWHELEIELVDGPSEALDRLDAALREAGARPAKSPSKLAEALGRDYPAPQRSRPRGSKAHRVLAAYLATQRDALVEQDPHVRDGDAEAVHKMRVATRRLRSTLRSFAPVLSGDLDALHDEIKWVTGLLGEVRDCDVMAERLAGLVADEPAELVVGPVPARITSLLAKRAAEAREALTVGLDSRRYTTLLGDIDALVARTAEPMTSPRRISRRLAKAGPARCAGAGPAKALMRCARRAVRRADARLASAGRARARAAERPPAPGEPTADERLHAARKAYKRARYAVELVVPLAGKRATRLAGRLTGMQDVLGAHQDALVTCDLLRGYALRAHAAGENAFTYGLLHARTDEHGRQALSALPATSRRARRAERALFG
ncbi:CYTH and CHAD domain-containing protein [Dactylosporangium sp. NPDC051484]|uniref:CYTH and CHAD domain-containing protein n=1 Tax=Dactylosporangium sp. NPDC051484 TaxID=3154942 RepID=UPI00344C7634